MKSLEEIPTLLLAELSDISEISTILDAISIYDSRELIQLTRL